MSSSQPGPLVPRQPQPSTSVINPLMCTSMEMGYVHSPMVQIIEEYSAERNKDDHSTRYRVQYYSNFDLTSDDVQDLGFDHFTDRPRYSLQPVLVEAVIPTIMCLQSALLSAALLLSEREVIFQVDPKQMFMNVLHGTNNVHLLYTAWTGLRRHLEHEDRFLFKYTDQYRLNAGLYNRLDKVKDPADRIRRSLRSIPSHRAILAEQGAELLAEGEDGWERIVPPNKSFRKIVLKPMKERSQDNNGEEENVEEESDEGGGDKSPDGKPSFFLTPPPSPSDRRNGDQSPPNNRPPSPPPPPSPSSPGGDTDGEPEDDDRCRKQGHTGLRGEPGLRGRTGKQGEQGLVGPRGRKGDKGSPGPPGPPGGRGGGGSNASCMPIVLHHIYRLGAKLQLLSLAAPPVTLSYCSKFGTPAESAWATTHPLRVCQVMHHLPGHMLSATKPPRFKGICLA
ncbi:hypothetical protein EDD85DRAFT_791785 [Armillaria nabsnona]|nr:hypothetical protein EDD85DRAFT_791785 [Armillaria nabsnona]